MFDVSWYKESHSSNFSAGVIVKVSTMSRMHIFVEFGLSQLYLVLKKKAFDVESKDDVARLDPFVDIILQCLKLKYNKVKMSKI